MSKSKSNKDNIEQILSKRFYAIKDRCNNPKNKSYYTYGGRGIKLLFSKEEFLKQMSKSFVEHRKVNKSTTLNRINNDKHYSLDNIEWASMSEQMRNVSTNKYLTLNGVTKIREDWAKELKISSVTLRKRELRGLTTDQVLNPVRNSNKIYLSYKGETLCIKKWSEKTGLSQDLIRDRFKKKWPVERILTTPLSILHSHTKIKMES
jgi:carbohydrate-binding DOMON domain-containing protein